MSWQSIEGSAAWHDFWASDEVQEVRNALLNQLRRGELDLQSLGRVRGQLDMMERLKQMAEKLAQQERDHSERKSPIVQNEVVAERSRMRRLFRVG